MKLQRLDDITIGRNPALTFAVTTGIYKRRMKTEAKARTIKKIKNITIRILSLNIVKP